MVVPESAIRDYLVDHLDVIEAGLTLIAKEYPVENPVGSKGFIDILARDALGNRVIIELKRSNTAARNAIHEIFKYVALFKEQQRVPEHKLRCVIVSTEWHELRVPFAELSRSLHFQVDGYEIVVNEEGNILRAVRQEPLQLSDPLTLFRNHHIYLFESAAARDMADGLATNAFAAAGGLGGFIIRLDCESGDPRVRYPHALYLVPALISPETLARLEAEEAEELSESDLTNEERRRYLEECFGDDVIAAVNSDTFEIGNPEKFDAMLKSGWKYVNVARVGCVPGAIAADDMEVLRWISGTEGMNAHQFLRVTSPRFHLDWADASRAYEYCLLGNEAWSKAAQWFCNRVATNLPNATLSFSVYNPLSLPWSLAKFWNDSNVRFLSQLELFAWDEHEERAMFLLGQIEWDGTTFPATVDDLFRKDIGGIEQYLFALAINEAWQYDAMLMERHGLVYGTALGEVTDGRVQFTRPLNRKWLKSSGARNCLAMCGLA